MKCLWLRTYHNSEKFTSQNFQLFNLKIFVFEGDRQKIFMGEFFNNVISSLVKCERQPDNGNDRYAAKFKHHLDSEPTFKHTTKFFSQAFIGPE